MSQHKRLSKLEALAKHREQDNQPIDFVSTFGSTNKYDSDVFQLLALATGRRVILPNQIIDGEQLRLDRWGFA